VWWLARYLLFTSNDASGQRPQTGLNAPQFVPIEHKLPEFSQIPLTAGHRSVFLPARSECIFSLDGQVSCPVSRLSESTFNQTEKWPEYAASEVPVSESVVEFTVPVSPRKKVELVDT
jgi:hypothetical protein